LFAYTVGYYAALRIISVAVQLPGNHFTGAVDIAETTVKAVVEISIERIIGPSTFPKSEAVSDIFGLQMESCQSWYFHLPRDFLASAAEPCWQKKVNDISTLKSLVVRLVIWVRKTKTLLLNQWLKERNSHFRYRNFTIFRHATG